MGKRQFRILSKDILAKRVQILNRQGHVILANHVVINGTIQEITESSLTLIDPRKGKHQLALLAIAELVYDKETEY